MLFRKLKWPEAEIEAKKDTLLVLPIGSIEQHGYHLPVDTDSNLVEYIAVKACERSNSLLLPTIYYGYLEYGLKFPGSISVSHKALISSVVDIALSLRKTGFRRLLIMCGHGGNSASLMVAVEDICSKTDMLCATCGWFGLIAETIASDERYTFREGSHAGIVESSMEYYLDPEHCDKTKAVREITGFDDKFFYWDITRSSPVYMLLDWSRYTKSGVSGDATKGDEELGKKWLEQAVEKTVEVIEAFRKIEHKKN